MKKIILIIILLTTIGLLWIWFGVAPSEQTDTLTDLPSGSGQERPVFERPPSGTYGQGELGTIDLVVSADRTITINDVRTRPETYHMGNGTYSLTGFMNNTPQTQFNITFTEADGSFAVALIREPLAESRKAAEVFLQEELGVEPEALCELNIFVGVPGSINQALTVEGNLGISYCPGAFPLE